MSTVGVESHSEQGMAQRKAQHLEICLRKEKYQVEGGATGFNDVSFYHRALPEIDANQIDLTTSFLGRTLQAPLFISSMTGGSAEGYRLNKILAQAAGLRGIPIGMGSMRILFRKKEVFEHFALRKLAGDSPILSNIGAVQIRDMKHSDLYEMNRKLEVDAQIIHLNPGQELFQPEGDRDFSKIFSSIERFIEKSPLPVIVKETGCGISPHEAKALLKAGAAYVDVAGIGGTNWITVESYRQTDPNEAEPFRNWGHPTAALLGALGHKKGRILASGGLRSGLDLAKSLALGAHLGGFALPLIRSAETGGLEGVLSTLDLFIVQLRQVMTLTGCLKPSILRKVPLQVTSDLAQGIDFLKYPRRRF